MWLEGTWGCLMRSGAQDRTYLRYSWYLTSLAGTICDVISVLSLGSTVQCLIVQGFLNVKCERPLPPFKL